MLAPGVAPPDRDGVRFRSLPDDGIGTAYFWRVWRRLPAIHRAARRVGADVYHLPDPALIPLGVALKLGGARVVYDAHEDRPRQALTKYAALERPVVARVSSLMWRFLEAVARVTFDRFVTATPAIARRYPASRTVVVHNFPRWEEFEAPPPPYPGRPNHVIYAGGIHRFLGLLEAVEAIGLLPAHLDARLVLCGHFTRASPAFAEELAALPGWERVLYLGLRPRAEVLRRLGEVRVGVTPLAPRPEHREAIGNKTFEYMAAGLPVVVPDFPVWRRVVRDRRAGITVDTRDPARVAAALQYLLENPGEAEEMGRRGREVVLKSFN